MKIVLFPGVGIQSDKKVYESFLDYLRINLQCEAELFIWEHGHDHPVIRLPYKKIREFVCEVILDFQYAIIHALETKVPEADLYIGHSAGSIMALAQEGKPCVIFGSPASLVELVSDRTRQIKSIKTIVDILSSKSDRPVLNIVNKYDVIAYPLYRGGNVENYKYRGASLNPLSYFPVTTHTHYWKSKKVSKKILSTIKQWQKEGKIV